MSKLILVSQAVAVAHNYSDTEVLVAAEKQFPNPPPVLKLLMDRYQRFLETVGDQQIKSQHGESEQEEEEDPEDCCPVSCPACGNVLTIVKE